jgi:hypothetical protein
VTQWTVRGMDFAMLCSRFGRDRLPYPLAVTVDVDTEDQLRRLRHEASARLDTLVDERLEAAIAAVIDPVVRIECRCDTHALGQSSVRIHAAVTHDLAVVLTQRPGPDCSVTIDTVTPTSAPVRIADSVPTVQAGRRAADTLEHPCTATTSGGAILSTATRNATADEKFEAFFARPRSAVGEVIVARGATYDHRRDTDAVSFFWMDFDGDGRYLVRSHASIDVVPADHTRLVAEIGRQLESALRR